MTSDKDIKSELNFTAEDISKHLQDITMLIYSGIDDIAAEWAEYKKRFIRTFCE